MLVAFNRHISTAYNCDPCRTAGILARKGWKRHFLGASHQCTGCSGSKATSFTCLKLRPRWSRSDREPPFGPRASLPARVGSGTSWEQVTNAQDAAALKLHLSPTCNCDQDGRAPTGKPPFGPRASLPARVGSGTSWEQATNAQDAAALKLHLSPAYDCDQDGHSPIGIEFLVGEDIGLKSQLFAHQ